MPESMSLKSLDPGIRRDDGKVINQRFLSIYYWPEAEHTFSNSAAISLLNSATARLDALANAA